MRLNSAAVPILFAPLCAAQTELYFGEYRFQAARISAVSPDGTNPHVLFPLPAAQWLPLGLTFDPVAGRIFWMDSAGASELLSANLDGSAPLTIATPPGFARGVGRDALGRLYFSTDNTVRRVDADGGNPVIIFTSPTADPVGNPEVDATNAHVYIGADGEILRMDLDGSNIKTVVRGISQPRAIGLDIGAGFIYWIDADTISDYVGRARLDDTGFTVLIDNSPGSAGSSGLIDLLVDHAGGSLYFADELLTSIRRANLDGSNTTPIYTSPAGLAPSGLTLSTGDPAQPLQDCNLNGVSDDVDIANGAPDCDNNGVPDSCQASPCPARVFLLDQGSNAASTNGRAVGVPSQWQVFQPFDVPTGGWTIGEIAIDGFTSNYADGSGLTLRLFPDDGSGARPNEAADLGSAVANLRFNTSHVNWIYVSIHATLAQGRYWVRIEANNPTIYGGSINQGFSGLQSRSRGSSGIFTNPAPPIALRVVQGAACSADFNDDGTLNSQDFFDFLSAFFAGAPAADFNHDTLVNSQDFFDFLTAFFTGC